MIKRIQGTQGGWFPVYWELFDDDNLEAEDVFFFCYLSEIFPILKNEQIIDGVVYKRLSDSFINEKLGWSRPTIRKRFETLENNGYIKLYRLDNKKNGIRYYSILLNIVEPLDSGYYHDQSDDQVHGQSDDQLHGQSDGQLHGKKFAIKDTKDIKESKDTKESKDIFKENPKTISDLIKTKNYPTELKEELVDYFNRCKNRFSIKTASKVLDKLEEQYNKDYTAIFNQVENVNLNGWSSLFCEQFTNQQKQDSIEQDQVDWNQIPDELKNLEY